MVRFPSACRGARARGVAAALAALEDALASGRRSGRTRGDAAAHEQPARTSASAKAQAHANIFAMVFILSPPCNAPIPQRRGFLRFYVELRRLSLMGRTGGAGLRPSRQHSNHTPGFIVCAFNETGWAFWLQLAPHSNGPCSGFAPDSPSASASTVRRLSPMHFSMDLRSNADVLICASAQTSSEQRRQKPPLGAIRAIIFFWQGLCCLFI